MKEWISWVLLIIGVLSIIALGWWLTTILSVMAVYYITVALNGIVMCYNMIEFGHKKKS